jgi:prepilin-type N-terminal cleavage/methylation domain-containing protein
MRPNAGFTLLEMTIAVALLSVVSLLSYLAIQSGAETSVVAAAKEEVAAGLRDTLIEVTKEARQAYTARTTESAPKHAPEEAQSIKLISSGKGISFYIPLKTNHPKPDALGPIIIEFENEDANGNGKLDSGEDKNGDGVLTRRLVRRLGNDVRPLGAFNSLRDVTFTLSKNAANGSNINNRLTVRLQGERIILRGGKEYKVRSNVESQISLEN